MGNLAASLRQRLKRDGDPKRAATQRANTKSTMPYAGVMAPRIKKLTKALLLEYELDGATHWQDTIRSIWDNARFREERYVAIGIARARQFRAYRTPAVLPLYEKLIVEGAWWDFIDEIAVHLVGELVHGGEGVLSTQGYRMSAARVLEDRP